jgi:exopolysaccharide production protein ExoZ
MLPNTKVGLQDLSDRTARPRHEFVGIQYLRAVAALMVAYFHVTIQIPTYAATFANHLFGGPRLANGVDLFFVISGFIMYVTSRRATPVDFLIRRVIRIVPLYWLMTLLLILLHALKPAVFRSVIVRADFVLKSLFFVPYSPTGAGGIMEPVLVAGWTLNFEMFFYGIFALALFAPLRWRLPAMGLLFVALITAAFGFGALKMTPSLDFLANPRLLEFWGGMALAHMYQERVLRMPAKAAWCLLVTCFALMLYGVPLVGAGLAELPRFFAESILPATGAVAAIVSLDISSSIPRWPRMAQLGDASYSIYLSHPFAFGVSRLLWTRFVDASASIAAAAVFGCLAMAICLVIALLTYRFVELPMHSGLSRWYRSRRVAFSPAQI